MRVVNSLDLIVRGYLYQSDNSKLSSGIIDTFTYHFEFLILQFEFSSSIL